MYVTEIFKALVNTDDVIQLNVRQLDTLSLQITHTWVGTLLFESTIDGHTWNAMKDSQSTPVTEATANGQFSFNVAPYSEVRVRFNPATSGSPKIFMQGKEEPSGSGGSSGGGDTQSSGADGESNTAGSQRVAARLEGFNGTTWDRLKAGITAVTATLTGFLNTLPWAIFHTTPSTRSDGQGGPLEADVNGNLKVTQATAVAGEDTTNNLLGVLSKPIASSVYAPSLYAPLTQVTKANIKALPGNVLGIYITNDNAAVRYFQLHNKATAPVATDVPLVSLKIPAGTVNNPGVLFLSKEFFTEAGLYFSTGIGWAVSTTLATFTDSATNTEHIVDAVYI